MDPPLTTLPPVQASSVPITPTFAPPPSTAAVAAPAPHPPLTTNNSSHPPYAQMITQAISALKERNGSSKSAITKYIEQNYTNLPGTHSALLTQHLKRLKESGQLVMVKHSYKLAGSAPQVQSNGPKRGPGRPPKPKFTAVNILAQDVQATLPQQVNATAGPGPISVPESVFQSLGLVDGPVKKRPGRPKKVGSVAVAGAGAGAAGLLQNPSAARKKRPGRPSKKAAGNAVLVSASGKPRGRPPRNFGASGKPRGRPPKNAAPPATVVGATGPILVQTGYVAETATAPAPAPPTMAAVPMFKKRGRPPVTAGGPKKPRKLTGKPLGRPRKKEPLTAGQVSNMQQLMAYQELRSKLEFIQARIKQTAGVLKPVLEAQGAGNALAAMQELEELAAGDVNAPLNLQNRQPPAPENRA